MGTAKRPPARLITYLSYDTNQSQLHCQLIIVFSVIQTVSTISFNTNSEQLAILTCDQNGHSNQKSSERMRRALIEIGVYTTRSKDGFSSITLPANFESTFLTFCVNFPLFHFVYLLLQCQTKLFIVFIFSFGDVCLHF